MKLSVLIKTYNEEAKIVSCLAALFDALAVWGGEVEVIIADSRSTDATVAIASRFPVTIVCLDPREARGCGIGVQLGFQHARGEFVLLLDGDMRLQPGFLNEAMRALDCQARIAGIAGIVEDVTARNWFDRRRLGLRPSRESEIEPWLGGGGLYRRCAIEEAGGYAGNRNLLAFEEAELGLRLRACGWQLLRLAIPYAQHTGHAMSTLAVVRRMWASGRIAAGGVLLRGALGKPWLLGALRMFVNPIAVVLFWFIFAVSAAIAWPWGPVALLVGLATVISLLALRRGSFGDAILSVLLWHLSAAGILRGFVLPRVAPTLPIHSKVIRTSDG